MLWGSINGLSNASASAYKSLNNQILLSWRMLPGDNAETAFDLYRQTDGGTEVLVNQTAIKGKTNFQDSNADRTRQNTYRLTLHGSNETIGTYTMTAGQAQKGLPYVEIPLRDTKDVCALDTIWYEANDVSVGDLDGDGVMELVVKRLLTHGTTDRTVVYEGTAATESPAHVRHTVLYEAYKLDGTFMWRICSGPNIMLGNSSSFAIADFDGDGCCEMAIKTGEGTVFGDGQEMGDTDGDGVTDYREAGKHYIGQGPEYFSIVDGRTGRELARADYITRGRSEDWGDNYYKRASSLRVAVANVSGTTPSVLICRGIYERSVVEAWDYNNGQLTRRWHFDSHAAGTGKDGKSNLRYAAQGFHSLSVGDVDGDGLDEVVYGGMTLDDDGQGLYSSEYGHGDALHLGKFDPQRDGLQIWSCQEFGRTEAVLRDAATGQTLWASVAASDNDTGRAMIADIDPNSPGCEMWWYQSNAHSAGGEDLGYKPTSCNMAIWFGAGLNRQLLNETSIHQQHDNTRIFSLYRYDVTHINGTKGNPCWYGDIVGDWREEVVMPDSTRTKNLKVFATWYPTNYQLPWLMTDHVYQMSALNQNVGYNMPTQVGYYIGSDMQYETPAYEGEYVEVEVGATGFATFGNTTGRHLTPAAGISAYSAKPSGGQVLLTRLDGIPQTAGVILKGEPNTTYKLYHAAEGVTYSVSNNYMQRVRANGGETLQQHPDATHWNYLLGDAGGVAKFFLATDGTTLAKGKAYLRSNKELTAAIGASGFQIVFDDEPTGIRATSGGQRTMGNGTVYDMQGRKVDGSLSGPGIYLVNKKKVVIK
ncbi:MAG: hypothetical protein IJ637_04810 [Prevotella sp.]|nr:hypothetical protein [Prevotella sp.]